MWNQEALQERLQALINGEHDKWTYGIFWQSFIDCSGRPILRWGDGYYRGEVDNKMNPSLRESSAAEQEHRKKVLRAVNGLITGNATSDDIDEEVNDSKWFFLASMTQSFVDGIGLPRQAFLNKSLVWVAGSDQLSKSSCGRARQAEVFGLQTVVCIPGLTGVIELGSTALIVQSTDLVNKVRGLFHFIGLEAGLWSDGTAYSNQGGNNDQSSIRVRECSAQIGYRSSGNGWKYDVFLSFRGTDTRNRFTGHLYQALCNRGINTFIDDKLNRGEEISPALLHIIEESRISIVIFSENYASSSYCLDELVKIVACKESKEQVVFPVFFNVDPSDVEEQKGSFEVALQHHLSSFGAKQETVQAWSNALTNVARLSGWHLDNGNEAKFIQKIVEKVLTVLNRTSLNVPDYLVGLDSHISEVNCKLSIGSNDVHVVGIWGTGGVGKTTVAKAVYNRIFNQFEGSCFLTNVREMSKQNRVVELQETLLSQILGDKKILIRNSDLGINMIRDRLCSKQVLIVIDDVDNVEQLRKLAGELDWFGARSRIIITSRDEHLLVSYGVKHIHKVEELCPSDARLLFSQYAYRNTHPTEDFIRLSYDIATYAKGLPLALVVLGSFLCGRSVHEWESELQKLKQIPNKQIHETLKISYDGLEDNEQAIFLDIACFFRGMDKDYVMTILDACNFNPVIGVKRLTEKSLISIENNKLQMHDLVQAMGRQVVMEESPRLPGMRSRLWFHEDVLHVLRENTGTDKIEGIMLELNQPEEIHLVAKAFKKMKRLRILIIRNALITVAPLNLPNELRWLEWPGCPLVSMPPAFEAKKLVVLNMQHSFIRQFGEFKNYRYLKFMDFRNCEFLTELPDFSTICNLESLNLESCTNLVAVHESVGCLDRLEFLGLEFCSNLRILPSRFQLKSLETLLLTACKKLESFPDIVEQMPRLEKLCLSGAAIKVLPSSIRNIIALKVLTATYCKNLATLPSSIYTLRHLDRILLEGCSNLGKFPVNGQNEVHSNLLISLNSYERLSGSDSLVASGNSLDSFSTLGFPQLRCLDLRNCNLVDASFLMEPNCFSKLKELDLSGNLFVVLPAILSSFANLKRLKLSDCIYLLEIPELPKNIKRLEAGNCGSLERHSQLAREMNWPARLRVVDFPNCHLLAENQGKMLEKALLSKGFCTKFPVEILLPGRKIPEGFTHHSEEGFFTFHVPPYMCEEIEELVFCSIFHLEDGVTESISCETFIDDQSAISFSRQFFSLESDHMWLYCYPYCYNRALFEQRDSVCFKISFDVLGAPTGLCLKRCGVHIVYKINKAVDYPNTSQSTSHHTESVSLDLMRTCCNNELKRKRKLRPKVSIKVPISNNLFDVPPDKYSWRKYGQNVTKGSPYPRLYYKCSGLRCPAKKKVETCVEDPTKTIVTYKGEHNHSMVCSSQSGQVDRFEEDPIMLIDTYEGPRCSSESAHK